MGGAPPSQLKAFGGKTRSPGEEGPLPADQCDISFLTRLRGLSPDLRISDMTLRGVSQLLPRDVSLSHVSGLLVLFLWGTPTMTAPLPFSLRPV